MLIKEGDTGRNVKEIQTLLDVHGFWTYSKFTKNYGSITKSAVERFQRARGLSIDGKVGHKTLSELLDGVDTSTYSIADVVIEDTDGMLDYKGSYEVELEDPLTINRVYLDTDQYVRDYGKIEPLSLFLHHTAGWNNPYNVANDWNTDKRGRVGTGYIIGGKSIRKGKYGGDKYDGEVIECFPDNYFAWNLGKVGNFDISIYQASVELANFGYAIKKGDKFYNYINVEIPKEMICDLGFKFRGYRYYHKYTDAQIESLRKLIIHIHKIYPKIEITKGIPELLVKGTAPKKAFDFNTDAYNGIQNGTWCHTNVRTDKFDLSPQPNMVNMLKWVYNNLK